MATQKKATTAKTAKAAHPAASAKIEPATVGRQELSRRISTAANVSQKQASAVLEATLDSIREALEGGDEVRLVGFGSFKGRTTAARQGVNPRDRKPIPVPPHQPGGFFPGKEISRTASKR